MSTSVSSSAVIFHRSRSNTKQGRSVKKWATLIATLILAFVLFIVIRTQGFVSGEEFSPTHFQQRSFSLLRDTADSPSNHAHQAYGYHPPEPRPICGRIH